MAYSDRVDAFWNHMMDDCPECWEANFTKERNYCTLGKKLSEQAYGDVTDGA